MSACYTHSLLEALRLINSNCIDDAEKILRPLAELHPYPSPLVWFGMATCLQRRGQYAEALIYHEMAIQGARSVTSELPSFLCEAARCALQEKQFRKSVELVTEALTLQPSLSAVMLRAEIFLEAYKHGCRAETCSEDPMRDVLYSIGTLLKSNDNDLSLSILTAKALEHFQIWHRALDYYKKALSLIGDDPEQRSVIGTRIDTITKLLPILPSNLPPRRNILLYSIAHAGGSAIDPILREILSMQFGYDLFHYSPGNSSNCLTYYADGPAPIYAWTHSPPEEFSALIPREDYKFLCLFRDPRDIVVSIWHTRLEREHLRHAASEHDEMINVIQYMQSALGQLIQWMNLDLSGRRCFCFDFETMKKDIPLLVSRIFQFLELEVDPSIIQSVCNKHSFETVTKRERGSPGPMIYCKYFYRTGTSGNWKPYFTDEIKQTFKDLCGQQLISLGYEVNNNW